MLANLRFNPDRSMWLTLLHLPTEFANTSEQSGMSSQHIRTEGQSLFEEDSFEAAAAFSQDLLVDRDALRCVSAILIVYGC